MLLPYDLPKVSSRVFAGFSVKGASHELLVIPGWNSWVPICCLSQGLVTMWSLSA